MRANEYPAHTIRIPGHDCLHHLKKRCVKDEPSAAGPQCRLLRKRVKWARSFARSLKELKRLRPPLKRETVLKICGDVFRENFTEMEEIKCDLIVKTPGNLNDCSHFHRKMCLLKLPPCPGRCTDYLRRDDEKEFFS